MKLLTFCKFDLTNVSPDGVLLTHSGGRLSLRASSGVTFTKTIKDKILLLKASTLEQILYQIG